MYIYMIFVLSFLSTWSCTHLGFWEWENHCIIKPTYNFLLYVLQFCSEYKQFADIKTVTFFKYWSISVAYAFLSITLTRLWLPVSCFRTQESCCWMRRQGELCRTIISESELSPVQTCYSMLCVWQCTGCGEWASGARGYGANHERAHRAYHRSPAIHHPQCRSGPIFLNPLLLVM